ncbi:DUF5305 domain-containing protein [Salinirarus marinus]
MRESRLRFRAAMSRWFAVVVVLLVVLAGVGGWATYTSVVEPGTHTEERTVSSWSSSRSFTHGAQVVRSNPVFPVGSRLSNRSVYFRTVAPVLDGAYLFSYRATESGSLAVTANTSLVIQGVESPDEGADTRNVTVHWQTTDRLAERSASNLQPGQRLTVPFSVNATQVRNRTQRIGESLGSGPGRQRVLLRVRLTVEGTVNGQRLSRTRTDALALAFDGDTYRVDDPGRLTAESTRTRLVGVANEYGPLWTSGGPALFGLSLVALGGLVAARRRGRFDLSAAEREYLDYLDDREEFDEWITTIRLPASVASRERAEAVSLADLVDFAIDTDNAVVERPDGEAFYVVHDDLLYTYTPPTEPAREGPTAAADTEADESPTDVEDGK